MRIIHARNVHEALAEGLRHLKLFGTWEDSRAGRVRVSPHPVMTVYYCPTERVLFWPQRDANPFFHLMEALWMLAGRNDLAWLERFNTNMRSFSDDGEILHGAYGHRWLHHFQRKNLGDAETYRDFNQLDEVVGLLRRSIRSRRAVIQMWDCQADLDQFEELGSKDTPCNTHIYLAVRNGRLDMTTMSRSHDIIWGAYGANAVHFSFLQEYLAARLALGVGLLYQFSNNYHAYEPVFNRCEEIGDVAERNPLEPVDVNTFCCPYHGDVVFSLPLVEDLPRFESELWSFMENDRYHEVEQPANRILKHASIVRKAYLDWKETRDADACIKLLRDNSPSDPDGEEDEPKDVARRWDFELACVEWLERRKQRQGQKSSDAQS